MARSGGVFQAAAMALRQVQARVRDPEAATIAAEVYAAAVEARGEVGAAPLWAVAPFVVVAQQATKIIVKAHRLPAADEEEVAAYVVMVLSDVFMGIVGSFDRGHFERWRAGDLAPSEVAARLPDE